MKLTQKQKDRISILMGGLAAGDCLGSATEFQSQGMVPEIYAAKKSEGWPFKPVAEGVWSKGEPTDDTDMAECMVDSYLDLGKFEGIDIAHRFLNWLRNHPKDVGISTRSTLQFLDIGVARFNCGSALFQENNQHTANGSLMRNGSAKADSIICVAG